MVPVTVVLPHPTTSAKQASPASRPYGDYQQAVNAAALGFDKNKKKLQRQPASRPLPKLGPRKDSTDAIASTGGCGYLAKAFTSSGAQHHGSVLSMKIETLKWFPASRPDDDTFTPNCTAAAHSPQKCCGAPHLSNGRELTAQTRTRGQSNTTRKTLSQRSVRCLGSVSTCAHLLMLNS